eukprot:jgi/Chlat1/644/Chrsp103S00969
MALRCGRLLQRLSQAAAPCRQGSSAPAVLSHEPGTPAPRVSEKTIDITVFDRSGHRHQIKGLVGRSLLDALVTSELHQEYHSRGLVEGQCFGNCGNCHVTVSNEALQALPERNSTEQDILEALKPEGASSNYRYSCQLKLGKNMDGMVVSIAEWLPWYTL